jgi:hypothetical protein
MEEQDTVELDITDEEFIALAKEAHMQDLTFNQYINQILKSYIESFQ